MVVSHEYRRCIVGKYPLNHDRRMDLDSINRPRERPLNCDQLELRVEKGDLEMFALFTTQT